MIHDIRLAKALTIGVLAVSSSIAMAAETVTGNASVTVQNAFNLSETTALSFGTIRATGDTAGTETAALQISSDGTSNNPTSTDSTAAAISVITAGNAAVFTIDSAAPSSNLTITLPSSAITLTSTLNDGLFSIDTFEATITSGPRDGTAYSAGNLLTDSTGAVTFAVGATLTTGTGATDGAYDDGSYTGTYSITVDY
ncbi:DUF4402 domain-containing protein [Marinomonas mediterranea]|jgi:hypothetical protein|uniref:DUF4402 domain-containing protein n=1 Tax=Marinomonas mediterranea (strain ATCC 700492 / JCM 21426 / NBRC 103028 / MMB-1) TaxID=717774 RepID=F2JUL8_MARM1|nr:DUF4402 domain-containing protein [Marinomonas mediterranea]ADZ89351.1 hypothetical protein Marme_0045 [Marinomonas mediterranea MMB-1]WCN07452.1 DUF4402 domain-containing protein [Marinomonas mediterranea]WCN11548.1 DUF4402 domain-containing protein [Marinomonas mediterranea]WCN15616.1 DUF4402 domain-containing protein [Marinomonas mediterranea MMB-1]